MVIEKGPLSPELVEAILQQIAPELFGAMRAAHQEPTGSPLPPGGAAGAGSAAQRGSGSARRAARRRRHPRRASGGSSRPSTRPT